MSMDLPIRRRYIVATNQRSFVISGAKSFSVFFAVFRKIEDISMHI